MQKLVLDSDTVSEILKGRNAQVVRRAIVYQQEHPRFSITSATILEILYGYERIQAHAQIRRAESLFSENEEIVPGAPEYRLAATIAGALDRQGTTIGLMDPLIAACAIRRGWGIASGNTLHYEFIRRLGYDFPLENWRDS